MSESRALAEGQQLGRYRLEYRLGSGGMGTVWAAYDSDLDRRVALKVLNADLASDEVAQVRLQREAMAMARLRHPNVITVFDVTQIDDQCVIAMELVDGQTMAAWLATERRDPEVVFRTLLDAGRGLSAAHAAGMIHRDFKPHNVLVETAGRVLVTDFGLARTSGDTAVPPPPRASAPLLADTEATRDLRTSTPGAQQTVRHRPSRPSEPPLRTIPDPAIAVSDTVEAPISDSDHVAFATPLTRTGTVLGTPAYMAPEQFRGEHADARADQFAFCVTAWEAVAGTRPFAGQTLEDLALAVQTRKPADADRVPRKLRAILQRGLATEPEARWPSMTELLTAMERAWRAPRRRAIAGGIAVLAVSALVGTVALATRDTSSPAPAPSVATCATGSDALRVSWSPAKRTELDRLAGPGARGALEILDRWGTTWIGAYDANCRAPGDPDFSARRLCLEAQRDDIGVMLKDLTVAARAIGRAELARALPSAVSCQRSPRAIAPPLPADPLARETISDVRVALHTLKTDAFLGKVPATQLEPVSLDLIAQANALAYPPVHAEALFSRALVLQIRSLQSAGDRTILGLAREAYAVAANRAEEAGYDRVRVDSLLGQLECAFELDDGTNLDDLVRRTEVAIARLGDPGPELVLEMIRAKLALRRGHWSDAVHRAERARIDWEKRGATDTLAEAALIEVDARVLRHAGDDLERALAAIAIGLSRESRPAWKHGLLRHRAVIEWRRGNLAEARTAFAAAGTPSPILDGGGGDPGGGVVHGRVTGMPVGIGADPTSEPERGARRSLPWVVVRAGERSWTLPVTLDGTWRLDRLPPGRYTVSHVVESARGDTQIWRVAAMVTPPAAQESVARSSISIMLTDPRVEPNPADSSTLRRVTVLYPGTAVASTPAVLRAQLAEARWLSAFSRADGGRPPEATALGPEPAIVCELVGAKIETDQIIVPDSPPPACAPRSTAP